MWGCAAADEASPVGAVAELPAALAAGKNVCKGIGLVEVALETAMLQVRPPRGSLVPKGSLHAEAY